jgi:hypothetical protein
MGRALTQSMIKTFTKCPRQYYYEYVECIVPKRLHFPFIVGGAVHSGIESLLKDKKLKKGLSAVKKYMRKEKKKYTADNVMSAEEDQEFEFQKINAVSIVENYYHFRKIFLDKVKVIASEKIVQLPYDSLELPGDFIITGKVDAVIKHKDYKKMKMLFELKTTKSASYQGIMHYYSQFLHYFICAQKEFDLDAIYIEAIQKPQLKLGKNEDIQSYMERLKEKYGDESNYFYDVIEPKKRHLRQTVETIKYIAKRIYVAEKRNKFPHYRHNCTLFGVCPYKALCDDGINAATLKKFRRKTSVNEELEL